MGDSKISMSQMESNPASGELGPDGTPQSTQDLTIFVQNLLQQMQSRFQTMSDAIIGRIDEMGNRIDDLENSINELMQQAGIEETGQPDDLDGSGAPPSTNLARTEVCANNLHATYR